MKHFHVHYLIRASATELCARQGRWPHGSSERGPPKKGVARKREMLAAKLLRKKVFTLGEGLEDVLWEVVL